MEYPNLPSHHRCVYPVRTYYVSPFQLLVQPVMIEVEANLAFHLKAVLITATTIHRRTEIPY